MAEKKYVNGVSVKEIEGQYGSFFNVSFNLDKLQEYKNSKGYVNVVVSKRKEKSEYGETHTVVLNEWSPEKKDNNTNNSSNDISISDIPF